MLRRWHGVYDRLADDLQRFRYDTDDMLTDYFEELPSRRPEAYAAAFEACMASFREIYMQTEDEEDLAYMNGRRVNFPVSISFVVERDKKTGQPFMAERMTFEDLISSLYMDLYRGMAAGNVPRQCHNCGRWFLAIGAYEDVYKRQEGRRCDLRPLFVLSTTHRRSFFFRLRKPSSMAPFQCPPRARCTR